MIKEDEIDTLGEMEVHDKDDTGKYYKKTIKFLVNSVRITFETLERLIHCSTSARVVYVEMLNQLGKYNYELTITRKRIKSLTGLSDTLVSLAIKELKDTNLIEVIDKDTYHFPINKCVKGNVNTIIENEKKKQEELLIIKQEEKQRQSITELSLKLRNKNK